jgi:kynureninase
MNFQDTLSFAQTLDQQDPLCTFRSAFYIPQHEGKDVIYFTGNSLGLQPKRTAQYVQQELEDWARLGVEGHFHARNPWMPYHEILTNQIASVVGGKTSEVVAMNQLTVNLHLLMVTFYRPTTERFKIICEAKAFPSDQYALESQVRYHGFTPEEAIIEIGPRVGESAIREEDILAAIEQHKDQLALVLIGGVNYYTGQVFDMPAITKAGHLAGAIVGFDLAHAVGNIELHLHDWGVDFATWCSYKYLNSGPGGVSGIYIHESHATNTSLPRFAGWWGYEKDTRFKMDKGFKAIPTAEGWQLSNAPILSMAAHKASLDVFEEAGWDQIHIKRKLLSGYTHFMMQQINALQPEPLIQILTPADEVRRGCQVSLLMLKNGKSVFDALTKQGVIADWREPNVIRIAPVPLYNSYEDVWRFTEIIKRTLTNV